MSDDDELSSRYFDNGDIIHQTCSFARLQSEFGVAAVAAILGRRHAESRFEDAVERSDALVAGARRDFLDGQSGPRQVGGGALQSRARDTHSDRLVFGGVVD